MLSNMHYYHRTIRKMVVAFGTIFNNLKMIRYDQTGTTEIERINVPLSYASKEKFYKRMTKDPDHINPTQIALPHMAFEFNGLTYDPLRKTSSFASEFGIDDANHVKEVRKTPYNFDFNLYIFVRNTEDGTQLIEQILPYFTPDYTVNVDFLNIDGLKLDVPIVFNTISYEDSNEGDTESTRTLVWTLNFTVKGYLFGPISSVPVIRESYANVSMDIAMGIKSGIYQGYEMANNSGRANSHYKTGELVYQGNTLDESYARAYVKDWIYRPNSNSSILILYDEMGRFKTNADIIGAVTNTNWLFTGIEPDPARFLSILVTPDPLSANVDSDFGYTSNADYLFV